MENAAERVYRKLRLAILHGELSPGTRLRETSIAQTYQVSRTPVRDALRRLLADGLIDFEPNAGARVASMTRQEAEEITEIRALLEGHAAALAARKVKPDQLKALTAIAEEMRRAVERKPTPDYERIAERNNAFHSMIVDIASNARLKAALSQVLSAPLILRKFAAFDRERLQASVNHHAEIIAALKAGAPDWASSAMRMHIFAARSFDDQFDQGTQVSDLDGEKAAS